MEVPDTKYDFIDKGQDLQENLDITYIATFVLPGREDQKYKAQDKI